MNWRFDGLAVYPATFVLMYGEGSFGYDVFQLAVWVFK